MSWWGYVTRTAATDRQRDITDRTGIDAANISRWKKGQAPGPLMVATFARAYRRPVLEAFIAAGFLTADEAKERPAAAPSLDSLSDDELIEELRQRLRRTYGTPHSDYVVRAVELDPDDSYMFEQPAESARGAGKRTSDRDPRTTLRVPNVWPDSAGPEPRGG